MLILTRKEEESIIIDDEIEVKILEVNNNRVQVGIEAPESIPIHRQEVYQEIQQENKKAAQVKGDFLNDLPQALKTRVNRDND